MSEKNICCICGKEIKHGNFGNNPIGALHADGSWVEFEEDDRCCDRCNAKYVLTGRMYKAKMIDEIIAIPETYKRGK